VVANPVEERFGNHLCPCHQGADDEDRDDSRNVGLLAMQRLTRLLFREYSAENDVAS
jgi:hypothetical protein